MIMLKLHLVDLFSIIYTANFATNAVTNRTDGALAWEAPSAVGAIISSRLSATLFIALHGVQWRIFSKCTVAHTKMGHVSKPRPF